MSKKSIEELNNFTAEICAIIEDKNINNDDKKTQITALVAQGADINNMAVDGPGGTPFHSAFHNDNIGIIEFLCDMGLRLLDKDYDSKFPNINKDCIYNITIKNNPLILNLTLNILKDNAKELNIDLAQEISSHLSYHGGFGSHKFSVNTIKTLENFGYEIPQKLMINAAKDGSIELLKYLIEEKKWDINSVVEDTPLTAACQKKQYETVKYLISRGADSSIKNTNGKKALEVLIDVNKYGKLGKSKIIDSIKLLNLLDELGIKDTGEISTDHFTMIYKNLSYDDTLSPIKIIKFLQNSNPNYLPNIQIDNKLESKELNSYELYNFWDLLKQYQPTDGELNKNISSINKNSNNFDQFGSLRNIIIQKLNKDELCKQKLSNTLTEDPNYFPIEIMDDVLLHNMTGQLKSIDVTGASVELID